MKTWEQFAAEQGYDLTTTESARTITTLQGEGPATYLHDRTEHAWRGWVHGRNLDLPEGPFVVKQSTAEERPVIKGNGFDGLEIGKDREEAEAFIRYVNMVIYQGTYLAELFQSKSEDATYFKALAKEYGDKLEKFSEAIHFALNAAFDGLGFLRFWNEGEFVICRRIWPEAPEAVYIGADPTHPETKL